MSVRFIGDYSSAARPQNAAEVNATNETALLPELRRVAQEKKVPAGALESRVFNNQFA
jgi:hypothetical protein